MCKSVKNATFADYNTVGLNGIIFRGQLDLREANKKLQAAGAQNAKAGEDTAHAKKQLQEEFKKLDDARRQFEEQRRTVENKRKDVEEKEKALAELDRQLKKRKEQMDQMEASLRKVRFKYTAHTTLQKYVYVSRISRRSVVDLLLRVTNRCNYYCYAM